MARFLNIYPDEEMTRNTELLERSISKLPYTLSFPVEKAMSAIEQQQYGKAMNHILDFFEISAPFISFVFLRLLQEQSDGKANLDGIEGQQMTDGKIRFGGNRMLLHNAD